MLVNVTQAKSNLIVEPILGGTLRMLKEKENAYFVLIGPERSESPIRKLGARFIQPLTEAMHRRFPYLTPTHLNILGIAGVSLGSLLAARHNLKVNAKEKNSDAWVIFTLLVCSSLLDGLDGSLARLIAIEDPDAIDLLFRGTVLDSVADYLKEMVMFASKAVSAHERNDRTGEILSHLSAVSSPLSSLSRAYAEASGKVVPEIGDNIVEFFGTRTGRTICSTVATVFPELSDKPLQSLCDTLIITGNVANVLKNTVSSVGETKEAVLSRTVRNKAMLRTRLHMLYAILTVLLSLFLWFNQNRYGTTYR